MRLSLTQPVCIGLLLALLATRSTSANTPSTDAAPRAIIERDWMLQDHGIDTDACFQATDDASIETRMIECVLAELGEEAPEYRKRLNRLKKQNLPGADPQWRSLYFDACQTRRTRRLAPLIERYPKIVYTKHFNLGGSHYAYTENVSDAQSAERDRTNPDWKMGASLCLMEILPNGDVRTRTLVETTDGMIRDPDVSYDGRRILFSKRDSATEDDYHLYDMDVDTGAVRQLTFGRGFADDEPVYLPGGDIIFNSTRCMQIVDCFWTEVTNLYTCDGDGRLMRRLTFDQVNTNYPKVLNDGRIIYTRWDYNDRGQIYPQPLFVMNPDGTGQTEYYGNNSWFPTTIMHARGIPGTQKLIAIASGHHTHQRGKLIVIDRAAGTQEASGVRLIAPVRETPAEKIDRYGQEGEQFQYPYPVDETHFLVTYDPIGSKEKHYAHPYGLYFMDIAGRRELLAWDATISCNQAVPLAERPRPLGWPSPVDYRKTTGTYYVQDVYHGPGLAGIERGTVKRLRVVALEFRAAGIGRNGSRGPAGGALSSTPPAIDNGTWDVKRVLGSVPVEADGSAYFTVPARTPVYFQLLDDRGYVVQSMRSWSTLQPGEYFSCVGCHEDKNSTGPPSSTLTLALKQGPRQLEPFHGPTRGFSYPMEIQPIWDKHCVDCHTGGLDTDGQPAPLSLLGNTAKAEKPRQDKRDWSESYVNLTQWGEPNEIVQWLNVQSVPTMLPPYYAGAAKSRLMTLLEEGHEGVRLSRPELETVACWIDLLVPYCGDYWEANAWTDAERAEYIYYETKRDRMAAIESANIAALLSGDPTAGAKRHEYEQVIPTVQPDKPIRIHGMYRDAKNVYRNLAVNPKATQGRLTSYPHATSNSEYKLLPHFAARCAIDGKNSNTGHGPKHPSWGPHKRTDLWWQVDFGRTVQIDQLVLSIRADFPHDGYWHSATIEFSDGTRKAIRLKETAEPQSFRFASRNVRWLKLTDLVEELPLDWCALTEVEAWGRDVE